jgi:hypothetical protein
MKTLEMTQMRKRPSLIIVVFQMVVPFVSNDNNAEDNIKSISCTPSS